MKNIAVLIALITSLCITCYGQSPQFNWAGKFETGATFSLITPRYIQTDANNNCIVGGDFYGQVDFNLDTTQQYLVTSNTTKDYFLAKYDPNGAFQWVVHFEPTVLNNVFFYHIACDAQNNIFIWGNTKDTIDVDPSGAVYAIQPPAGKSLGFILKYNSAGNFVDARTVGVTTDIAIAGLTTNKLNQVFLFGSVLDTVDMDLGPGVAYDTVPVSGNKRFILKLDNDLNYIWHKSIVGQNSITLADLAFDSQSNLYFTGNFNSTVDFNPGPSVFNLSTTGANDGFVLALDPNGTFIDAWKIANCTDNDYGNRIIFDEYDFMYVYGAWSNLITFGNGTYSMTAPSTSANDNFLMKSDIYGNVLWAERVGIVIDGFSYVVTVEITYDQVNGLLLGGSFSTAFDFDPSPTGNTTLTPQGSDAYLLNLDPNGHFKSVYAYSSTGTEIMYALATSESGNIYCGGVFRLSVDFDGGPGQYILTCPPTNSSSGFLLGMNNNTNTVSGRVYQDQNTNAVFDGTDYPLANCVVKTSEERYFITTGNGNYLAFCDTGNIDISYNNIPFSATSVPSVHSIVSTTYNNVFTNKDFAIQVPSGTPNGMITFTNINRTRSGQFVYLKVEYKNIGTTAMSGTLKVVLDSRMSYSTSIPAPQLTNVDTITYSYSNLLPQETRVIDMSVLVDGGLAILTTLTSYAELISSIGDINYTDNIDTLHQLIFASYDPNDKQVLPDAGFTTQQVQAQEYLEYIVRFQNTGNDTAFVVQIEDTISPFLDLSTFEVVSSSHPHIVQLFGNNILKFIFNNILLPDSNINEPASHGFIRYRIKVLPGTNAGSLIENTAYIYFDLNDPITTNTVTTIISTPSSINEMNYATNEFKVYPVPAKSFVNIVPTEEKPYSYSIYNLAGSRLFGSEKLTGTQQVNIESLNSGIYLLRLQNETEVQSVKLIIVK